MAGVESEEAVVAISDTGVSDNTQPTQPEMTTDRAQDDVVMQDELELEFRRLCGDDKERAEVLQVCDRLGRSIKGTQTTVMAEVSKRWRTGNPDREAIESAGRQGAEQSLELVETLKALCKRGLICEKWIEVMMFSLQCHNRGDLVDKLDRLLERDEILQNIAARKGWQEGELAARLQESVRNYSVLQEEMRSRESELQELRQRCREQDEELQRLRQRQAELSAISDNTKLYAAEGRMKCSRGRAALRALRGGTETQKELVQFQAGYDSSASEREWSPRPAGTQSTHHRGQEMRRTGETSITSESEEGEIEESAVRRRSSNCRRSDHCREEGMSSYLKYIALPDVKPYSGTEKGYSFQTFVEAFELKYPVSSWADTELCALLRAKLVGKARSQYEALPRSERRGSYEVLKRALARECRAEERTNKVLALGQLRHLRKAESQSIAEFCVELERLTRQAYPELDEKALATERAHLLYEQLVHWKDSYYLMEALESEDDAYMKLKATAQRIERRDLTLRNVRAVPGVKSEQGQSARPPVRAKPPSIPGSMSKEGDGRTKGAPTAKEPLCFTCKKPGHRARDCPKRAVVTRVAREQEKGSLSARLLAAVCRSGNSRSVDESQSSQRQKRGSCPLYGKKSSTKLEIFGRTWMGLLDTGSEISILPAEILLQAQRDGVDIDHEVKECPMEKAKPVQDASGARMQFVTVVEVPVTEVGRGSPPVDAKMHVSKRIGEVIIGTNMLPLLGYELRRLEPQPVAGAASQKRRCEGRDNANRIEAVSASVVQRTYLAPGAATWLRLEGCEANRECLFDSKHAGMYSGWCRTDHLGQVTVPVVNRTSEAAVFRVGDVVGHWDTEGWSETSLKDVPSDMLSLHKPAMPKEQRLSTLQALLTDNRKGEPLPAGIWEMIAENHDLFAIEDSELTQTQLVTHEIDTGETRPIRQRTRPVPLGVRSELREILQGLLERGVIERSHSPWASPVVLVRKKDGSLRLCVDYRELNKHIKQDAYPLPAPDAMLQSLQGKRIFTSLDLCSGYWQIPLSEDARAKSAFTTAEGLFEFTVLPFGLSTSPAEFQRMMDRVLGEHKDREVFVYIDDILVATEAEERHQEVLAGVLQALRNANLKLKPQKCVFMEKEIVFLGHKVDASGLKVDPDKVTKVEQYPKPSNLGEMRTFLGLCGYYRKFIWKFASIARPLFDLTSKKVKWEWKEDQEVAFAKLKAALSTTPVLAQPDVTRARTGERPFIIYTDASQYGVGAVLCQEGDDGFLHPLYFASRSLTKAERNYHVTDAEALAVVFALRKFHFFVYGLDVTVRTDHLPLTALFKRTNISGRVLRWALEILQYKVKIEYVKGQANRVADALSRGVPCAEREEELHGNVQDRLVCVATTSEATPWLRELSQDPEYGEIIKCLEGQQQDREIRLPRSGKRLKVLDFVIDEGDLKLFGEDGGAVRVVPTSKRRELFEEAHKGCLAGHFSTKKMLRMLRKQVFWDGMERDVAKWTRECQECFLANPQAELVPGLRPIVATKPFEIVCVDILEMGRSAAGMKYILVLVDHFSKWLGAYPLPDKSAKSVAEAIFQRWICEGGRWPGQLHSDQGSEFVNTTMAELAKMAGVNLTTTKGYNSRANGACERAIGTLQRILKKKVEFPDFWDTWVPNAVYAYNVVPHVATGESPFFLLYGFDPRIPSKVIPQSEITRHHVDLDDYKSELMRGLQLIRDQVREHADGYREKMRTHFDSHNAVESKRLPKVGSRVFMKLPAERRRSRHPKLAQEWDGPFRVLEVSGTSALITRIDADEEPLRVQMELLRVCPQELVITHKRQPRTRRRRAVRVSCVSVSASGCALFSSGVQPYFFREAREFDVSDEMHCLHGRFRCQGQPLPLLPSVPQMPIQCNVSGTITAGELIPDLPEPALSHRVECVLEAARCLAIWQGVGTRAEKCGGS
ncbi:hypothetical protein Q1695_014030 [Nippostrongylus brasiliensis]|nr:hypothetical protein Q1695_014030 [Nippostrongylus brasiliensis]